MKRGGRRKVQRGRVLQSGQLLEPAHRFEELVAVDVGVARDRREVGVTEELGRGGVAQRVGRDVLRDVDTRRRAMDDVGERRLLKASACESAEHGPGRTRPSAVAQPPKLAGDR